MFANDDVPDHFDKNIVHDDFLAYLDKMRKLRERLAALGQSVNNDDFAAIILSSLLERTNDSEQDKDKDQDKDKGKGKDNIWVSFWKSVSLLSLGAPSLDKIGKLKGKKFTELRDKLMERTKNLTVVSALAVSTTISFLTAPPPVDYAAWDNKVPYLFIAGACWNTIMSTACGLGLIMYLGIMTEDSIERIKRNFERYIAVALLVMPTVFLFVGAGCGSMAWLVAVCARCAPISGFSQSLLVLLLYHNMHLYSWYT
ncbi:hypothetical protein F5J12DRAFT_896045 [Pisolithus orientalis]|uniref:uncharacterized protein n=1 Tax=Pisolithus orientalis TaxID=936130 RepID=UPI0022256C28|nr:uncharacterized protein F5J12DRAFT_896045 [Pisolithus orientalis]KAI5996909.1 hypothetical protein F5J12DRAFT_896045 [Pisolithus orientalis]